MKKLLMSTLIAAAALVAAPAAFAGETTLNVEQMDQVTAGTWTRPARTVPTAIVITNSLTSNVNTQVGNNIRLTGGDFKAAAPADAFTIFPAYTTAVAVSSGNTVITFGESSSFAVSESTGAIQLKY